MVNNSLTGLENKYSRPKGRGTTRFILVLGLGICRANIYRSFSGRDVIDVSTQEHYPIDAIFES